MSPEEPIAEAAYDHLADEYAAVMDENPYNAHFERPATTSLLPAVKTARILDAGCGTGWYAEWVSAAGATAVGLDVSAEMLAHASDRLGDEGTVVRGDLGRQLPFRAGSFDGVVSGLAMGYVRDWELMLSEFARVLKEGGFLVFSILHPMDAFDPESGSVYYDVELARKEWEIDVPFFRRPLSAILEPVLQAGFRLERVFEPQPTADFADAWPDRYETEAREPVFLCVRASLGGP